MTRIDPKEIAIIKWSQKNGKTAEETKEAIRRYRLTGSPALPGATPPETTVTEPVKPKGLLRRFSDFLGRKGDQIGELGKERIVKPAIEFGKGSIQAIEKGRKGVVEEISTASANLDDQETNPVMKGLLIARDAGLGVAREGVETGLGILGAGVSAVLPDSMEQAIGKRIQEIAGKPEIEATIGKLTKKYAEFELDNPEAADAINDAVFVAFALGMNEFDRRLMNKADQSQSQIQARMDSKGVTDVQKMIQNGEIPREAIYLPNSNVVDPTSPYIIGKISDISRKLDEFVKPGLRDQFIKQLGYKPVPVTAANSAGIVPVNPLKMTMTSGNIPPKLIEMASKLAEANNVAPSSIPFAIGARASLAGERAGLATRGAIESAGEAAGKVGAKIDQGLAKAGETVGQVAGKLKSTPPTVDELVGRIIQGGKADIPKARRALSDIDTTGVETYAELNKRINARVGELSDELNKFLDEQPGVLTKDDLVTTTKVGDTTVSQNFVAEAIDQLDELYTKIKDGPAKARVTELQKKLESEGLTRKEINNLAKEYGQEFGSKAFSKTTGDPLTSVNAQAFENTRKGIKQTFRDTIEGDLAKTLDQKMSDLISTSRLTQKMETKVNALYQKVQERGLIERIAGGLAKAVDVGTFRSLSGFLSKMLPSNVGLKTMNSIAIEEALSKTLTKIDELLKTGSDSQLIRGVQEIIKSNQ